MRFIFLVLLALQMNLAHAEESFLCAEKKGNEEIRRCLNEFAKAQLQEGSAADAHFHERLNRLLAKYSLTTSQVKVKPLGESFSIIVDANSQVRGVTKEEPCFNFDSYWQMNRTKLVNGLKKQIEQAALFLAEIHASSWGHQVSLLFPIKEVSICSQALNKDRDVLFEQRSLILGFHRQPVSAHDILNRWNSGTPIRNTELSWMDSVPVLNKLRALKQKRKGDYEGIFRDKIADNWLVLNPTGSLRTTALYTMGEAIFKIREGLKEKQENPDVNRMFFSLMDAVRGPGFSQQDQERLNALKDKPAEIQGLYNLWQQKIYSPQNILTVIENAIGDQARRDSNVHLVLRNINAGVAVVNDKNIAVRLEQLMESSIPVSEFESASEKNSTVEITRTETLKKANGDSTTSTTTFKLNHVKDLSLNADQVNGGVVVDLIDNVVVSVQIPNISASTYRRVCLYQALREFVEGGGSETILP